MKAVLYTRPASRRLRKLPIEVRRQLEASLERYAQSGAGDVKKMRGAPTVRLRSGDYRVIFTETDEALEVSGIGHRRDVYD